MSNDRMFIAEANKKVLRRLFDEVINGRNFAVIDELFAPDYVNHGPFPANTPDLAGLKRFFAANPQAFPDMRVELQDVVAEGDLVAYRAIVRGTHRGEFAGLKPTGRAVEVTEINISKFRDGRMVEHWALLDEPAMIRQLTAK
jgi:predicted ester cyclase